MVTEIGKVWVESIEWEWHESKKVRLHWSRVNLWQKGEKLPNRPGGCVPTHFSSFILRLARRIDTGGWQEMEFKITNMSNDYAKTTVLQKSGIFLRFLLFKKENRNQVQQVVRGPTVQVRWLQGRTQACKNNLFYQRSEHSEKLSYWYKSLTEIEIRCEKGDKKKAKFQINYLQYVPFQIFSSKLPS